MGELGRMEFSAEWKVLPLCSEQASPGWLAEERLARARSMEGPQPSLGCCGQEPARALQVS